MTKIKVLGAEITHFQRNENSPEFEGIKNQEVLNIFILSEDRAVTTLEARHEGKL